MRPTVKGLLAINDGTGLQRGERQESRRVAGGDGVVAATLHGELME